MRIVFLDMDGVLSSPRAFMVQRHIECHHRRWIDPVAVRMLNTLLRVSGAQVVVSSAWRQLFDRDGFRELLLDVGGTDCLHEDWRTRRIDGPRGCEVAEWLSRHPDVTTHVILDDESDFSPLQPLVKTNSDNGWMLDELYQALRILCPADEDPVARAWRGGEAIAPGEMVKAAGE